MGTDIHGYLESRSAPDRSWYRECEIEDSRNYHVFAVLADVRNGYGFAGVPTHQPLQPIAAPRGLPADHTTDAEYEFGDHSFSWLSLAEVLDWDGWDQVLHEQGYLGRDDYAKWTQHKGVPTSGWSGGVSGRSVIHADHDADYFPDGWTHVKVSWSRPLRESCRVFLAWLEYAAKERTEGHEARIVFGFDS